jgi:ubiquinone/menaquinone biosynthesis C-methylase UbiE
MVAGEERASEGEPQSMDESVADGLSWYYGGFDEGARLLQGTGRLEMARMRDLLSRYLPEAPADIADVGGGTGPYAVGLAERGYRVRLVDAVAKHVEQARAAAAAAGVGITAVVGDARSLEMDDESMDAVLLMGPLYHLTERADRLLALAEARRVLRPDGMLFAVGISRFASLLDGYRYGFVDDPAYREILEGDLADGQHRNPEKIRGYFMDTFFHLPEELEAEIDEAGFARVATAGVQGPFRAREGPEDRWDDVDWRERLLDYLRQVEEERSLLGASAHLMTIARRGL